MITQVASILESKIYLGLVFFDLIPEIIKIKSTQNLMKEKKSTQNLMKENCI